MAKDELAVPESRDIAIQDMVDHLRNLFVEAGIEFENDPALASLNIAMRIAEAKTIEEVLNPQMTVSGKEQVGRPFKILGGRALPSGFPGGIGAYLLLSVVFMDTGEQDIMTSGSTNVMVQVARAMQLGAVDEVFQIVEAPKTTSRGFTPLWLAAA